MRVSYSALETYKNCPLKFKYQVLDKIKTPKGIEAVFGTTIHSALKMMFERTPLYPTIDEIIDFFNNRWFSLGIEDEEKAKAFFEEGVFMLKNFYKKNPPWNFNAVETESRFDVVIEDPQNEEKHVLAGIMDRIDKDPNSNIYEIIDYKTAKRMPSKDILDKNLQLSIYNLGLLKKWSHLKPENVKLSFYFLKHNEKIETKRTTEDLEETKIEILKVINEIQNIIDKEKEFIPTPSALCDWCGYKERCPMWRHLYATEEQKIGEDEVKSLINTYLELKGQNSANNKQIKALQASICSFMDQEGVERVFGETGYLTRVLQERTGHDIDKIKKILYDIGRWDEVVTKKQFTSLKATKKKIDKK